MRDSWNRLGVAWCSLFHRAVSQPWKGRYVCLTCGRAYPVPWEEGEIYARRVGAAIPARRSFPVFEFEPAQS